MISNARYSINNNFFDNLGCRFRTFEDIFIYLKVLYLIEVLQDMNLEEAFTVLEKLALSITRMNAYDRVMYLTGAVNGLNVAGCLKELSFEDTKTLLLKCVDYAYPPKN